MPPFNQSDNLIRRRLMQSLSGAAALSLLHAQTPLVVAEVNLVPKAGEFPKEPGNYLAGELVTIDAINRRGGLRLDGDLNADRYHRAQPVDFAMLPYGMIYYHGAPAELRDIPLGTHLHGSFYLPPKDEEKTIPPSKTPQYGSK
jgi:hypothetical protein